MKMLLFAIALISSAVIISNKRDEIAEMFGKKKEVPIVEAATPTPTPAPLWDRRSSTTLDSPRTPKTGNSLDSGYKGGALDRGAYNKD